MSGKGAFNLVLHSHLPYARLAGRWPHGEEWLHEAATETYIPLLQTLYALKDDHIPFHLTLGLSPVLCEQLADSTVQANLVTYLDEKIAAATRDMGHFSTRTDKEAEHLSMLAQWHRDNFQAIKYAFLDRFQKDIIGAFRRLQDDGNIELMVSAATHAYLPLLSRDSSIMAQLKTGIASYERYFGRKPTVAWLPECAYRPAYITEDNLTRPGLETLLAQLGIKVFFSETHTITGGQPVGLAAGDAIGPYGAVRRQYVIPTTEAMPQRDTNTFRAYYVSQSIAGTDSQAHSGVAVLGRNNETGQQVWSSEQGYPGDFDYREFYKKSGVSGLPYWRVTGDNVSLDTKDFYYPDWAAFKVDQHAEHFAHLVGDLLRDYQRRTRETGILVASYDTELFGHWWFEGVRWLEQVLRHLVADPDVSMMTTSAAVETHPPHTTLHLPESSWGTGGAHFTWDNNETHWMWEHIAQAEIRMEQLANRFSAPSDDERLVLNQAAREVLLLQSSDWEFLVTSQQARQYAIQRFTSHTERFQRLATSLDSGQPDRAFALEMWEIDKVFPDIEYRWFATTAMS
jgi:1,4-alpha-glucan branching enzyme